MEINIDRSKFIAENGAYRLQLLFYEHSYHDPELCIYTTAKYHKVTTGGKQLYSIYLLYLEEEDVTEYEFACKYFNDYTHWVRLTKCNWFKPFLTEMREALMLKLKARALRGIAHIAGDSSSKSQLQALRYMADKGYIDKATKGRPSKEAVAEEAKLLADERQRLEEEFERILN